MSDINKALRSCKRKLLTSSVSANIAYGLDGVADASLLGIAYGA